MSLVTSPPSPANSPSNKIWPVAATKSRFVYQPPDFSRLSLEQLSEKAHALQRDLEAQISMLGLYLVKYQTDVKPHLVSLFNIVEKGFKRDISALCSALTNQDSRICREQIPLIKKLMDDLQLKMKDFIEIGEKNKMTLRSEIKSQSPSY